VNCNFAIVAKSGLIRGMVIKWKKGFCMVLGGKSWKRKRRIIWSI
jgi:hypothetical protein